MKGPKEGQERLTWLERVKGARVGGRSERVNSQRKVRRAGKVREGHKELREDQKQSFKHRKYIGMNMKNRLQLSRISTLSTKN